MCTLQQKAGSQEKRKTIDGSSTRRQQRARPKGVKHCGSLQGGLLLNSCVFGAPTTFLTPSPATPTKASNDMILENLKTTQTHWNQFDRGAGHSDAKHIRAAATDTEHGTNSSRLI